MPTSPPPDTGRSHDDDAPALARLLTPEGMHLLDSLGPYRQDQALGTLTRLRAEGFDPELVAEAMTQSRLRTAAVPKFGEFAARMLFTQAGLEQATRLEVSALHAQRFLDAGVNSVADLGCGIGADAMAFAALDLRVVAVERDEATAAVATINLTPFANATVVCAAAESVDWGQIPDGQPVGIWLDPARRTEDRPRSSSSQRIFDPEAFSPPLSFVQALAATGAPVGVKLGPGIPHTAIPVDCEAQWVSHRGDVVEVVLWFNSLARPGVRRSALVLHDDGTRHELTSIADFPDLVTDPAADSASSPDSGAGPASQVTPAVAPMTEASRSPHARSHADSQAQPTVEPGTLLWEPDGAVIRAGLVRELGEQLGATPIHPKIAYLVGPGQDAHGADPEVRQPNFLATECEPRQEEAASSPFARAYRVREVLPHTVKVLKAWVKEHKVGTLEIKKRGTDVTPEQLRKQLKPSGPNRATLIVTRLGTGTGADSGERRVVLVVDPLV